MSDWHGWKREGRPVSLHIGKFAGRKRLALYVLTSTDFVATIEPLAWFTSEAAARRAMEMLDMLIQVRESAP